MPTVLIWGADDGVVPPAFGEAHAEAFPNARFVTVPGAGHMPTLDRPEETFGLIDEFLTRS